jgi:hypothetical protein
MNLVQLQTDAATDPARWHNSIIYQPTECAFADGQKFRSFPDGQILHRELRGFLLPGKGVFRVCSHYELLMFTIVIDSG